MKKLRYIYKERTSDEKSVYFGPEDGRHTIEYSAHFAPEAELPDKYADRLLANPRYAGWFELVSVTPEVKPEFVCDVCGRAFQKSMNLGAHKRTHSKKRGNNETPVDVPDATVTGS